MRMAGAAMAVAESLIMAVVVAMTMAMAMAVAMAIAVAMAMAVVSIRINRRLRHTGWPMSILAGDLKVSGGDGTLRSNGRGASNGAPNWGVKGAGGDTLASGGGVIP